MGGPSNLRRTQTAVVGDDQGGVKLSSDAPVPQAADDIVVIRAMAVSVNPVDAKMTGPYVTPGAILGCDVAGVVEEVGPDVTTTRNIKPGDRVFAILMGMNPLEPSLGAFASYVGARPVGVLHLPKSVTFESGSAFGTSFMTAGLALFRSLDLPGYPLAPSAKSPSVLVYGGSTATGTAALQLLRLGGFVPLAVCSPHSFDLVRSYGAEAVFDYHSADCAAAIRAYTKNGLRYALDCISTSESMGICYSSIGRAGGRYTSLDPSPQTVAATRKIVKADWVLGPAMLGKDIGWPAPHGRPADPETYEFAVKWTATVQDLLDKGLIREHPLLVRNTGLSGAIDGLEAIRSRRISGKKLVYTLN